MAIRFATFQFAAESLVALTAGLFELSLVENLNLTPTIVDKTCLLQHASGYRYAGAPGS